MTANRDTNNKRPTRTTKELLRTWSDKSLDAILKVAEQTRKTQRKQCKQHKRSNLDWKQVYRQGLVDIFQQELECDIRLGLKLVQAEDEDSCIGTSSKAIPAHHSILRARNPKLKILQDGKTASIVVALTRKEQDVIQDQEDTDNLLQILLNNVYGVTGQPIGSDSNNTRELMRLLKDKVLWVSPRTDDILKDMRASDPSKSTKDNTAPDDHDDQVTFVGTAGASPHNPVEWSVKGGSKAILCAQSEYVRGVLQWRRALSSEDEETKGPTVIRVDSQLVQEDALRRIVSMCHGRAPPCVLTCSFHLQSTVLSFVESPFVALCYGDPIQSFVESMLPLIQTASYLGMKAASLRLERTILSELENHGDMSVELAVEMLPVAEEHGAELVRRECYEHLAENFGALAADKETLQSLSFCQMKQLLSPQACNNQVEAGEEEILDVVLRWTVARRAPKKQARKLVKLVRLPFVPVDAPVLEKAIAWCLIKEDEFRRVWMFQRDSKFRASVVDDAFYQPRPNKHTEKQLAWKRKLQAPGEQVDWLRQPDWDYIMRLLDEPLLDL